MSFIRGFVACTFSRSFFWLKLDGLYLGADMGRECEGRKRRDALAKLSITQLTI
jgi:hypothetical protein